MSTCNTRRAGPRGTSWFWACNSPSPTFLASLTLGAPTRYTTLLAATRTDPASTSVPQAKFTCRPGTAGAWCSSGTPATVRRSGPVGAPRWPSPAPGPSPRSWIEMAATPRHSRGTKPGSARMSPSPRAEWPVAAIASFPQPGPTLPPETRPEGRLHPNALTASDIQQPTTAMDGPQGYRGRLTLPSRTTKFPDHSKESA
jgi:hypothetical protein